MNDSPELRQRFDELRSTLDLADEPPVPERGDDYGAEVWRRLEGRLPVSSAPILPFRHRSVAAAVPRWMSLAAAALLLLGLGFLLGRLGSPAASPESPTLAHGPDDVLDQALSDRGRKRLLHAALTSHFGRSERLLTEISNASDDGLPDPVLEQAWASELLTANRLYRRAAEDAGQKRIARLLAELEPVLLELAHAGPEPSNAEWNQLKRRVDEQGLLFKVRVTEDRLDSHHPYTTHAIPHRETI